VSADRAWIAQQHGEGEHAFCDPECESPGFQPQPAVRLRAAAALVRERAVAATPGPWHRPLNTRRKNAVRAVLPEGERGEWIDGIDPSTGMREHCTVATIPIWSDGKFARARGGRDLEWIALIGPVVGEPLAAWLETVADRHYADDVTQIWPNGDGYQICGGCSPIDNEQRWPCPDVQAALAVADALLAVTS